MDSVDLELVEEESRVVVAVAELLVPWSMDHGPFTMVHGPWSVHHGPWAMVREPWSMGHGPCPLSRVRLGSLAVVGSLLSGPALVPSIFLLLLCLLFPASLPLFPLTLS